MATQQLELGPAEQHLVAAQTGRLTILNLLDSLPWFKAGADWTPWRAFLCAVYGLPMTEREFGYFKACTGRTVAPTRQASEVYCIAGRRGRKSAIEALMAVWAALSTDFSPPIVAHGERALIPIMGKNKFDAKQVRTYALAILRCPALRWMLEADELGIEKGDVGEEIRLSVPCDMAIRAASRMSGRSRTIPLACVDEGAFWAQEGAAASDEEVIAGVRPGMATMGGKGILAVMSSPWTKTGILATADDNHWAKDDDPVLVWRADTITMHDTPSIRAFVAEQYQRDAIAAATEYGAEWRAMSDTSYISEAMLDAIIVPGRLSLRPDRKFYWAFADPSGGAQDSFALCIAHWQPPQHVVDDRGVEAEVPGYVVVDKIVEWRAPFDTDDVTASVAIEMKAYGVTQVHGDHYSGGWVRDRLRKRGIMYVATDRNKSEIYCEFLPIITAQCVELPEHPVMVQQLLRLIRRPAARGADLVDHPKGEHDDVANAVAGACVRAYEYGQHRGLPGPPEPEAATNTVEMYKRQRAELMAREKARQLGKDPVGSPRAKRMFYRNRRGGL